MSRLRRVYWDSEDIDERGRDRTELVAPWGAVGRYLLSVVTARWFLVAAVIAACSHPSSPPAPTPVPWSPWVLSRCATPVHRGGRPDGDLHADRSGTSPTVRNLHLTYLGDPSTSVVVQWSTDAATLASEVRYGQADGAMDKVAHGVSYITPGVWNRRQHEVALCDLQPDRRYLYVAGGSAGRSPRYGFVTAPAEPSDVRVMVAGDARSNPDRWGVLADLARAHQPDVLLFSGDAVADGASQAKWDAFFEASPEFFATVPTMWADGNHEGASELYGAQFALPDDGALGGHSHWYALTYGPMRVVVLNDTTVDVGDIVGAEAEFLRGTLANVDRARTPFVVTMHHQPMFTTSSSHRPFAPTLNTWLPIMDAAGVDVDISGHVHSYESSVPMRGGRPSEDGHGTRFFAFGGAGASLYGFHGHPPAWLQHRESVHGFAMMSVGRTHLRWEAFRGDGSLIETVDIDR